MNPFTSIERATALDGAASAARTVVEKLLTRRSLKDALHGVWLGHPLHPALAQLALGSYLSASIIDLLGGDRRESTRLIVVGLAASAPTAAAGWADYAAAHEEQQRLGIVHAAVNATSVTAFAGVLLLRGRGRGGRTVSVLAGALSGVAAALGGHMSYKQALGANHAEHVPHVGPAAWQPLDELSNLPDGRPVRRRAGDVAVVAVRDGDAVHVLSDTCPHLAGPISDGQLSREGELVCPWHGSTFRVTDGQVVHGPATASLPCFDTRVVDGTVQAKVREFRGVPAN